MQKPTFTPAWKKYQNMEGAETHVSNYQNLRLGWPIPYPSKMTRKFQVRGDTHWGIDFSGKKGAPIFAAHEGKVIYAGNQFNGYGNLVIIENPTGYASMYAHLSHITVREGDMVEPRTVVGKMGAKGRETGVHLHFELRLDRVPVDPLPYFNKN